MIARIFNCGESTDNYHKCLIYSVAGFKKKYAQKGDVIYFSVKNDKKEGLVCGARGIVQDLIDFEPWEGAKEYIYWYKISDIELCDQFSLKEALSVFEHWSARFIQQPKPIQDIEVLKVLESNFNSSKKVRTDSEEIITESVKSENLINITDTYKTVNFINETHPEKGIESLVNENFHRLFDGEYPIDQTILIPSNRIFKTSNKDANDNKVEGVSGIPDGLLISFNSQKKEPIQINILEYECYGEGKQRSVQKFNYLNGHVIPQLIRFASAFSIVTDNKIRDENIKDWVEKIIDYVEKNELNKVSDWLLNYNPDMPERRHVYEFEKLLIDAFRKSLRILLIIDELSTEQKETIKNVINSFKLEDGKYIEFIGYSVQLVEKIDSLSKEQYALTIQK